MDRQTLTGICGLLLFLFAIVPIGVSAEWSLSVTGPDGVIPVDKAAFDAAVAERGVTRQIDDSTTIGGLPLWRAVRMADAGKILGPGDIIEITGPDKTTKVPYLKAYKNDDYLLINSKNKDPISDSSGPVAFAGPDYPGDTTVNAVSSISISTTKDWTVTLKAGDETQEISSDEWTALMRDDATEVSGPDEMLFSGIPFTRLTALLQAKPKSGQMVTITGMDGYKVEIPWDQISESDMFVVASTLKGEALPKYLKGLFGEDVSTPAWPLMLIDPTFPGNNSVGSIVDISIG
ncbi:MAG TPA: hypothetical protein VN372_15615 [Methanospirillum sp.]|nr:hypothetical protein [Methanospirillum sp.]